MKGRKPDSDNVVPLVQDEPHAGRFDEIARDRARELRPRGMAKDVARVWDRIAPHVCHPTVDRLRPYMVEPFVLMCKALARCEELRAFLAETYETYGRNGTQYKSRPEVAQANESFRQFVTLARDFGLTPAAERGLRSTASGSAAWRPTASLTSEMGDSSMSTDIITAVR